MTTMQSPVFWTAIAMIVSGAAMLNYQRTGKRKLELVLILFGATLVVCGLAATRDVSTGSKRILWILAPDSGPGAHAPAD